MEAGAVLNAPRPRPVSARMDMDELTALQAQVLECLADHDGEANARAIGADCAIGTARANRVLTSLRDRGLVVEMAYARDDDGGDLEGLWAMRQAPGFAKLWVRREAFVGEPLPNGRAPLSASERAQAGEDWAARWESGEGVGPSRKKRRR